jgi:hypothetical protein
MVARKDEQKDPGWKRYKGGAEEGVCWAEFLVFLIRPFNPILFYTYLQHTYLPYHLLILLRLLFLLYTSCLPI